MAAEISFHVTEESEIMIAYSGSTVVLGLKQAQTTLAVIMTPGQAVHVMMEIKEALKDLNTEDLGE